MSVDEVKKLVGGFRERETKFASWSRGLRGTRDRQRGLTPGRWLKFGTRNFNEGAQGQAPQAQVGLLLEGEIPGAGALAGRRPDVSLWDSAGARVRGQLDSLLELEDGEHNASC